MNPDDAAQPPAENPEQVPDATAEYPAVTPGCDCPACRTGLRGQLQEARDNLIRAALVADLLERTPGATLPERQVAESNLRVYAGKLEQVTVLIGALS